jgi:hypothetical protein
LDLLEVGYAVGQQSDGAHVLFVFWGCGWSSGRVCPLSTREDTTFS